MADVTLYFDGLAEPWKAGQQRNPGCCCYGFVILRDGVVVEEGSGHLEGVKSNNCGEYAALLNGLGRAIDMKLGGSIEIFGDSKLVVEQVNGNWRINKPHLQLYVDSIHKLLKWFDSWSIQWVPREENEHADALSQHEYEKVTGLKVVTYAKAR